MWATRDRVEQPAVRRPRLRWDQSATSCGDAHRRGSGRRHVRLREPTSTLGRSPCCPRAPWWSSMGPAAHQGPSFSWRRSGACLSRRSPSLTPPGKSAQAADGTTSRSGCRPWPDNVRFFNGRSNHNPPLAGISLRPLQGTREAHSAQRGGRASEGSGGFRTGV